MLSQLVELKRWGVTVSIVSRDIFVGCSITLAGIEVALSANQ
jgi:hypothetical protein